VTSINSKLGLKPRTRARQATHGTALAGGLRCPKCASAHILRTQSRNGRLAGEFMCANCSEFFDGPEGVEVPA
jgi:predicted RNA-binding Zn-ribbon protein involved in translation (DUF1610 family)